MVATVRVNERTVVHKTSGGMSVAFPDPCLTPGAGPIPYLNVAFSTDAENTSATVYADGQGVMLKDSFFAKSVGDEPGTDGGVISGTYKGKASFSNYSFDVMIEGRNVCRLGDPMIHNHGSPANGCSPAECQPDVADPQVAAICLAICMCNFPGGKTACVRHMLAEGRWDHGRHYYDPLVPGIYLEVSVDMKVPLYGGKPSGPPTVNLSPDVPSKYQRDASGNPLPLPGGDWPRVPGSRRPDVVLAKDPTKPLTRDNIKQVIDIKYPPDDWAPGQREAYAQIDPAGKAPMKLGPEDCGCTPDQILQPVEQEEVEKDIEDEDQQLRQVDEEEEERKRKEREEMEKDKKKPWDLPPGVVVVAIIAAILRALRVPVPLPVP
jgi:hypothetical protein